MSGLSVDLTLLTVPSPARLWWKCTHQRIIAEDGKMSEYSVDLTLLTVPSLAWLWWNNNEVIGSFRFYSRNGRSPKGATPTHCGLTDKLQLVPGKKGRIFFGENVI